MFSNVLSDRLPPHGPGIDHEVHLKDVETSTWGPVNSMSRAELVVLEEWLEYNMSKGYIHQSSSPIAAPVLFPMKLDGGIRFCIEYPDIYSKTMKNQYPRPLSKDTLNLLWEARI